MSINPIILLKLSSIKTEFANRYPNVMDFFKKFKTEAIQEGTLIELKVTPKGKDSFETSLTLTEADIIAIKEIIH